MTEFPLRILVTGSRHWTDYKAIRRALIDALTTYYVSGHSVLVHGNAPGADTIAAREWIGLQRGWRGDAPPGYLARLDVEPHSAQWRTHGKAAGMIRNQEMVAAGADVCLAFPLGESRGTRGCMRLAEKAGIPVVNYGDTSWPTATAAYCPEHS